MCVLVYVWVHVTLDIVAICHVHVTCVGAVLAMQLSERASFCRLSLSVIWIVTVCTATPRCLGDATCCWLHQLSAGLVLRILETNMPEPHSTGAVATLFGAMFLCAHMCMQTF